MTFSILARDGVTGKFGVATMSFSLAVGRQVPHLCAGVGAAVTQAGSPPDWGEKILGSLASGERADAVLAPLAGSADGDETQVAILDAFGGIAVHSGNGLEGEADHAIGEGLCAAANLMEVAGIPQAAVAAYASSQSSTFSERLLVGLVVAEQMGGDVRGRQSAALRVVAGEPASDWSLPDLRVDDSRDPVSELVRLHQLWRAHELLRSSRGADGLYRDLDAILAAVAIAPHDQACLGAATLGLLRAGRITEAMPLLERLVVLEPRTRVRLRRLVDGGQLDRDAGLSALQKLTE
jgi:uncharacterized Ntn-hydrolase superfamily protein